MVHMHACMFAPRSASRVHTSISHTAAGSERDTRMVRMHAGMFAPRSASRVHTVMAWLQQCIMERRREGGLQVRLPL